jgi:hypothetical protein
MPDFINAAFEFVAAFMLARNCWFTYKAKKTEGINYTLFPQEAAKFARKRGVDKVSEYLITKADVCAIFLRRGEFEVLVLDRTKAELIREIPVVVSS